MSNHDIEQLRALVLSARSEKKGPFPRALRERLNGFLKAKFREGESLKTVGEKLGLSIGTVQYWRAQWHKEPVRRATLRRVKMVSEKPAVDQGVTMHGPAGTRIDGLSLDDVADLWRNLS